MIIYNQDLISSKQQEEIKKKAYEEAREKRRLIEEAGNKLLLQKEGDLIKRINALFLNQAYKFTANLSEDKEFIELYSQSKQKLAVYTKDGAMMKPVGLVASCSNKQEDLLLSRFKPQIYQIMEQVFN